MNVYGIRGMDMVIGECSQLSVLLCWHILRPVRRICDFTFRKIISDQFGDECVCVCVSRHFLAIYQSW